MLSFYSSHDLTKQEFGNQNLCLNNTKDRVIGLLPLHFFLCSFYFISFYFSFLNGYCQLMIAFLCAHFGTSCSWIFILLTNLILWFYIANGTSLACISYNVGRHAMVFIPCYASLYAYLSVLCYAIYELSC